MSTYLPLRHPDELLYSHLVRYIRNTLATNFAQISNELFGIPNAKLSLDLPTRLQFLYDSTYKLFEPSSRHLLQYTLLAAYNPFLTASKREYALQVMMLGPGTGIHAKLGITAGSSNASPYPKYCPICLRNDKEKYGEGYFHRVHQIPDIFVCPYHNIFIQEFRPLFDNLGYARVFDPAGIQLDRNKIVKNENPKLLSISQTFAEILKGDTDFDINTVDYYNILVRSKYCRGTQLKWAEIVSDFERFYGKHLLSFILKKPIESWIKGIVHRPQSYFHPLRHLLVTRFIETLSFKTGLFNETFPDGPWLCINVASQHYRKKVVTNIHIAYSCRAKTTVATATCSCGMVYTMKFKRVDGKLAEVRKIIVYGDIWNKSVSKALKGGQSVRSVALSFGVSHSVIQRWGQNPDRADKRRLGQDFQKVRDLKRAYWLLLLENESDAKISFARRKDPALYSWLIHNDRAWLKSINASYKAASKGRKTKLNWKQIDSDISMQLSLFSEKIKTEKFEGPLSKNLLSRVAGRIKYFSSADKLRLPNTNKILDSLLKDRLANKLRSTRLQ